MLDDLLDERGRVDHRESSIFGCLNTPRSSVRVSSWLTIPISNGGEGVLIVPVICRRIANGFKITVLPLDPFITDASTRKAL